MLLSFRMPAKSYSDKYFLEMLKIQISESQTSILDIPFQCACFCKSHELCFFDILSDFF